MDKMLEKKAIIKNVFSWKTKVSSKINKLIGRGTILKIFKNNNREIWNTNNPKNKKYFKDFLKIE